MNKVLKMFLNLTVIGALTGALLAVIFGVADPLIQANKEKELKESIFVVLPEAKDYRVMEKTVGKEKLTVYKGIDADGAPVGIAFKAEGNGFQGKIVTMVGLGLDYMRLKGIKVLEQIETPGLGNRIKEPAFEGQFKGVEIRPRIEYIKNRKPEKPNQIQAITGATISSDAVVKNLNNAIEKVLREFPAEDVLKDASPAPAQRSGKQGAAK
ncbi:MAG: RnfABCDGE type electron transport complex subunit G [Deltaproteobacteria bacterium]|nr:RnfABCDGE type electron transport complex subunit G [Deltaproteobacteria bacterium]